MKKVKKQEKSCKGGFVMASLLCGSVLLSTGCSTDHRMVRRVIEQTKQEEVKSVVNIYGLRQHIDNKGISDSTLFNKFVQEKENCNYDFSKANKAVYKQDLDRAYESLCVVFNNVLTRYSKVVDIDKAAKNKRQYAWNAYKAAENKRQSAGSQCKFALNAYEAARNLCLRCIQSRQKSMRLRLRCI